jgi:hypothetical protein
MKIGEFSDQERLLDECVTPMPRGGRTRSEYTKAVPHILSLAKDFGVELSGESELNVRVLMRTMEVVDRYLDMIEGEKEASAFLNQILIFLGASGGATAIQPVSLPAEIMYSLPVLREALSQEGTLQPFIKIVREVCVLGRQTRIMKSVRQYVDATVREGELSADLLILSIDRNSPSEKYASYLRDAAAMGTLADRYADLDVNATYGKIAFYPGAVAQSYMMQEIVRRASSLFLRHPNKQRFLQYVPAVRRYME